MGFCVDRSRSPRTRKAEAWGFAPRVGSNLAQVAPRLPIPVSETGHSCFEVPTLVDDWDQKGCTLELLLVLV